MVKVLYVLNLKKICNRVVYKICCVGNIIELLVGKVVEKIFLISFLKGCFFGLEGFCIM